MRTIILIAGFSLLVTRAIADDGAKPGAKTPEERVQALIKEYESAHEAFLRANEVAKTKEEWLALDKHPGRNPMLFSPGLMKLARESPKTTAAEDALVWVSSHVGVRSDAEDARFLIARDHIGSAKLAPVLAFQWYAPLSQRSEDLLRKALDQNPHREIQGLAAYWLGQILKERAQFVRDEVAKIKDYSQVDLGRMEIFNGPGWKDVVARADPQALDREAKSLFIRVSKEYGDLPHNDKRSPIRGSLGDAALGYLREIQHLTVGKTAPDIEGTDLEGQPFRLSAYRGKVVVLEFGSHFFCGTCRQLYPYERALAEKYKGQPFALVSIEVGIDDDPRCDRTALKKARAEEGLNWRCVWERGWSGPIYSAWNIRSLPTIYVIDQRGVIRIDRGGAIHIKSGQGENLDKVVGQLLAE